MPKASQLIDVEGLRFSFTSVTIYYNIRIFSRNNRIRTLTVSV